MDATPLLLLRFARHPRTSRLRPATHLQSLPRIRHPGPEALFPLGIGVCEQCGLIALTQNVPPEELQPRVDWISYREAEAHLDNVVERIASIGIPPDSSTAVLGISCHDVSTLERFARKNSATKHGHNLDLRDDLGITHPGAGIETIQSVITPAWAKTRLPADIIIARYILEHAHYAGCLSRRRCARS